MCAKPEPREYLQPIADLHEELAGTRDDGCCGMASNPLPRLAWVGTTTYYGLLENV